MKNLIIILINEEKYGFALELAIHNTERIKLRINELNEEMKEISFIQNNNDNKLFLIAQHKTKNQKDLLNEINLNTQFLTRSYFLLGICYDKIGENISIFDDKLKSLKSSISFFKLAHENIPDNLNFIYYLGLEYYNLRLYDQTSEILKIALNSSKKYTFSTSIHYFYIYCLNILVNIANLKFDNAYQLIETVFFNDDVTNFKFNILKILKFYINIYKLVNYTDVEIKEEQSKMLINEMITFFDSTLKQIDEEVELCKKKYTESNLMKNSNIEENYFKICRYNNFEKFENSTPKILEYNKSGESKKKFLFEKKNLEKIKIEFLKTFYLLFDKLIENKFDNNFKIRIFLNQFYNNYFSKNKTEDDDISLLTIVIKFFVIFKYI